MSYVPKYRFRWAPVRRYLWRHDFCDISVVGGVGDFQWSIVGSGFSLLNATTSERANIVVSDDTVGVGDSAIVTVVDGGGYSVEGKICSCYSEGAPPSPPLPPSPVSDYLYVTGQNEFGQLGLGDTTNREVFTRVDIGV